MNKRILAKGGKGKEIKRKRGKEENEKGGIQKIERRRGKEKNGRRKI